MSWSRREVLASLGIASAQAAMWACGAPVRTAKPTRLAMSPELRPWLRDAVATLRAAGFTTAHALAVTRDRTTAAIDVLGAGVARDRCDGLVLRIRDRDGTTREHVTNDLSRGGIAAAVKVLAGSAKPMSVDFGPAAVLGTMRDDPRSFSDGQLLARVGAMAMRDRDVSSRIVYSAALLDIDDATIWSVAPGRDLVQRLVRVQRSLTRVGWSGTQPVAGEASRAWSGGVDDQDLSLAEIVAAKDDALMLMTPRAFDDGEHAYALAPEVAASLIDAAVRALLTSSAAKRPEVTRRLAIGARAAAALVTLIDDPTAPHAYGGFQFDDEGQRATPLTLIDRGQIVGRLEDQGKGRGRRPGHVGRLEPAPSHLRLAPGTIDEGAILDTGFVLEGALGAVVDPASDRVVIAAARATERAGGRRTGRVYADIELVGELGKLLGSVTGLSKQTRSIGLRDMIDGQPRWRSIETPWLRGRGRLRAHRRPT